MRLAGRSWICRAAYNRYGASRKAFSRYTALGKHHHGAEATNDLARTRNIGIIAHIDAGKTTTTERMLYYSGYTRRIGDVDEGSTVTDFLPAERARGITIQSAAITFHWPPLPASGDTPPQKNHPAAGHLQHPQGGQGHLAPRSSATHKINLIDTPGHADFTFEVLRSLRILDGAVCILDGVAGVEAQTEKVWNQANFYRIPRLVYVNKLDRDGASFAKTVKEIGTRLHGWPAVCEIPWWKNGNGALTGVGDAINLRGLLYEEGGDGKVVKVVSLQELESTQPEFAETLKKARAALVELLSEHDDNLVEEFFEQNEDHLAISPSTILSSLRKCTLQDPQTVFPVFAGASFRNIGVQPLLDAVVDLLPAPTERPDAEVKVGETNGGLNDFLSGKLVVSTKADQHSSKKKALVKPQEKAVSIIQNLHACALAFKVVNDAKRGVLVYVRVYSGSLQRNTLLYNTNLQVSERAPRLLEMYANDAIEKDSIEAGSIGVIVGLKHARTGDTLVAYSGYNPKTGPPAPINAVHLRPIDVPPPVFFTSVQPNSLAEEKAVADTLAILLREDPSLHVNVDPETGQTLLSGMGELHLEIARDRLINDLKAKASIGRIEIGFREAVTTRSADCRETFDRDVGGKSTKASTTAVISPADEHMGSEPVDTEHTEIVALPDNNELLIHHHTITKSGTSIDPEQPSLPEDLPFHTLIQSLHNGVLSALARGPTHAFPVHSARFELTFNPSTDLFSNTTPAGLSSAARLAVKSALRSSAATSETVLMEPVMHVTISVDENSLGAVVHDISSARGGHVLSLDAESEPSTLGSATTADSVKEQDDLPTIDPDRIWVPPDPFGGSGMSGGEVTVNRMRQITARVPLKEMVGYLKHLRSMTQGRGTFVMSVDKFERMSSQRQRVVLGELRGGYI